MTLGVDTFTPLLSGGVPEIDANSTSLRAKAGQSDIKIAASLQ